MVIADKEGQKGINVQSMGNQIPEPAKNHQIWASNYS